MSFAFLYILNYLQYLIEKDLKNVSEETDHLASLKSKSI